jgi:hypothetical protein
VNRAVQWIQLWTLWISVVSHLQNAKVLISKVCCREVAGSRRQTWPHLNLQPRSDMQGAMTPLLYMPSWLGPSLRAEKKLSLYHLQL